MKKQTVLSTTIAAILGLSMASAANALVTFGDGGAALQDVLDDHTVSGLGAAKTDPNEADGAGSNPFDNDIDNSLSTTNVVTDQYLPDSLWSINSSGGSVATLIIELAGFKDGNSFGIYDPNTHAMAEVFAGSAVAGNQVTVNILLDGSVIVSGTDTGVDLTGNQFGYYLDVSEPGYENTWYSQTGLNADGMDHMAAYQGQDTDYLQLGMFAAGIWAHNEFILAWEDLASNISDKDYTDFVVMVESVTPMPEPGILALMGLGLLGFMGGRRFTKA